MAKWSIHVLKNLRQISLLTCTWNPPETQHHTEKPFNDASVLILLCWRYEKGCVFKRVQHCCGKSAVQIQCSQRNLIWMMEKSQQQLHSHNDLQHKMLGPFAGETLELIKWLNKTNSLLIEYTHESCTRFAWAFERKMPKNNRRSKVLSITSASSHPNIKRQTTTKYCEQTSYACVLSSFGIDIWMREKPTKCSENLKRDRFTTFFMQS